MKAIFLSFALFLACLMVHVENVHATDYNIGQCPIAANCNFSSQPHNASAYSDTFIFVLGNWIEYYGTYDFTSSLDVVVTGGAGITPCSGRGCHGQPYAVTIGSATLDGASMTRISDVLWRIPGPLLPGVHTIAVSGTVTGATWYGREAGAVQGIQYTLVPNPPRSCGDDCGD